MDIPWPPNLSVLTQHVACLLEGPGPSSEDEAVTAATASEAQQKAVQQQHQQFQEADARAPVVVELLDLLQLDDPQLLAPAVARQVCGQL